MKNERLKVGTREILGKPIDIYVTSDLYFVATIEDHELDAPTWHDLEPKIKRAITVAKIEHNIPLVLHDHTGYHRATLRGRNQRQGYLFTINGEKLTLARTINVLARGEHVTDDELKALNEAMAAVKQAQQVEHQLAEVIRKRNKDRYLDVGEILKVAETAQVGT